MIEGFFCIVVWLMMAGWALGSSVGDVSAEDRGWLLFACIIFAPVVAGAALAEHLWPRPNKSTDKTKVETVDG